MGASTIETVRDACTGIPGLQAAILFGSATRSERPRDLDLALLWDAAIPPAVRWSRANALAAAIERRLPRPALPVDVKDLRELSLPLQHRVLHEGVLACAPDRRALVRFRSETEPVALDFLPAYRAMLRAGARRLLG